MKRGACGAKQPGGSDRAGSQLCAPSPGKSARLEQELGRERPDRDFEDAKRYWQAAVDTLEHVVVQLHFEGEVAVLVHKHLRVRLPRVPLVGKDEGTRGVPLGDPRDLHSVPQPEALLLLLETQYSLQICNHTVAEHTSATCAVTPCHREAGRLHDPGQFCTYTVVCRFLHLLGGCIHHLELLHQFIHKVHVTACPWLAGVDATLLGANRHVLRGRMVHAENSVQQTEQGHHTDKERCTHTRTQT
mmetsp:Transcript_28381/g.88261  ORF Transcript_28381/g.88261 Transcript_28381/m.88261 type:complete len:245 (+) Transcript_28381:100-834(+)